MYQFIGQAERFYPAVFIDARSLLAQPGDIVTFDGEPPSDGLWVKVATPKPASKKDA